MHAEIIAIGDELLYGYTANTNAQYIGKILAECGVATRWTTVVGDRVSDIFGALQNAVLRSDVVITTGGLGPTHDDVTKAAVTEILQCGLVRNEEVLESIRARFQARGLPSVCANEEQAMVPESAEVLQNSEGTAPGLQFKKEGAEVFVLPGVPHEMRTMIQRYLVPFVETRYSKRYIKQRLLRTTGIPESSLFEKIDIIESITRDVDIAFLPSSSGVNMRITARGENEQECLARLRNAEKQLRGKTANFIYGMDDEVLEQVVAELLFSSGKTIAVAESCTGGLLAHKLTSISGSSRYFERGLVTYSNAAKQSMLDVPEETLIEHGAVSEDTAIAMAEGVRKLAAVDIGISTTGIAGPTGGTEVKPVGLVFIGFSDGEIARAFRFNFPFGRSMNTHRSVTAALELLRRYLLGITMIEQY